MNREERRAAMPICTEFIDEMRKVFGEPNYIKASENGHTVKWTKTANSNGVEQRETQR